MNSLELVSTIIGEDTSGTRVQEDGFRQRLRALDRIQICAELSLRALDRNQI